MGLIEFAAHVIDKYPEGGGVSVLTVIVIAIIAVSCCVDSIAKAFGRR